MRHVAGMAAQGEAFAPGYDRRQDRQQRRQRNHQRQEGGPHPGSGRGQLPADQECQQGGGRRKGTPDIVQHLPAAQRRHARTLLRIAKTDPQNPGQQLPVAAHPAVLARHLDIVARGKFLHQLDVGGQCGAREHAFEQIVAQDGVFGNLLQQCAFKGIDVVDALADKRTFLEQVLIDVGNRKGIRVQPIGARKSPLEQRTLRSDRQGRRHARLEDAIAL